MIKTQFGIKDLENFSGVKSHTIRIWEKRYGLLEPDRTDTNIRKYDLDNLKKLLNIAYLYHAGHKISKLAELDTSQLQNLIKEDILKLDSESLRNVFKTTMLGFDGELFDNTLEKLLVEKSFGEVFSDVFVPLLTETGILWHSGTIDPSHEHFISEKIKHAIIEHTARYKNTLDTGKSQRFVLYLPYQEIHEIGLLYANYELIMKGYNTIYLGANIPLQSLEHLLRTQTKVIFVTYFTVKPENDGLDNYLSEFQATVGAKGSCELWVLGRKFARNTVMGPNFLFLKDIRHFTDHLKNL